MNTVYSDNFIGSISLTISKRIKDRSIYLSLLSIETCQRKHIVRSNLGLSPIESSRSSTQRERQRRERERERERGRGREREGGKEEEEEEEVEEDGDDEEEEMGRLLFSVSLF